MTEHRTLDEWMEHLRHALTVTPDGRPGDPMRFTPTDARRIDAGKKTQARRPAGATKCTCSSCINGASHERKPRWTTGRVYPVLTTGDEIQTRIVIHDIRRERLGAIDFHGARAEGHRTTADFKAAWVRQHDARWVQTLEQANQDEPEPLTDEQLVTRFDARHARRPVWVLTFTREVDRVRLLAPAARPGHSELGYVTDRHAAMPDEPEAVPAAYQTKLSRDAEAANEKRRRERGEGRDLKRAARNTNRARDWRDQAA